MNQHTWFKDYSDNTRMIGTILPDRKRVSLTNFIKEKSFQKEKIIISQKITCQIKEIILDGQDQVIKVFLNIRVLLGEKSKKWVAFIKVDEKSKYLGSYKSEDEAAIAYNNAVMEYWGGNGYLNKIGEDDRKFRGYTTYKIDKKKK